MNPLRRIWAHGLLGGALAGALDVSLIAVADPGAGGWVELQSFAFWTSAGALVVASETGLGRIAHGVLVTVLLNLPWYVVFGPASGHPEHVPPLVGMSLVFGAAFGWLHGRARR